MDIMTIVGFVLLYNLILVLVPTIMIKFTKKYIVIFGMQVFLMSILSPILIYLLVD